MKKKDPSVEKNIMIAAMKDISKSGMIALPIIMAFELLMMIYWLFFARHGWEMGSYGYLALYLGLFGASGVTLAIILMNKDKMEKRYRVLQITQYLYSFFILLWALGITGLDIFTRGYLNIIVLATIITILPIITMNNMLVWAILQVMTGTVMTVFSVKYLQGTELRDFLINLFVFLVLSYLAESSLYKIRHAYYKKALQLTSVSEEEHRFAREDKLTGLQNRRSYTEVVEQMEQSPLPDNFVLAVFDLNGLKTVNDLDGHDTGDAFLRASAQVLEKTFGDFGTIYRIGGDEFAGVLRISLDELDVVKDNFRTNMSFYEEQFRNGLSISAGYCSVREHPGASFHELESIADLLMYENKRAYYAESGIERRKYLEPQEPTPDDYSTDGENITEFDTDYENLPDYETEDGYEPEGSYAPGADSEHEPDYVTEADYEAEADIEAEETAEASEEVAESPAVPAESSEIPEEEPAQSEESEAALGQVMK